MVTGTGAGAEVFSGFRWSFLIETWLWVQGTVPGWRVGVGVDLGQMSCPKPRFSHRQK